jgi:tetratricopeptide (TPR) repeat protein
VKEAEVLLLKAQNKDKNNVETCIALGRMYLKKGIEDLAKYQFTNATNINPKFVEGYYELAKMDVGKGRTLYDDALTNNNAAKKEEAGKFFKSGIELYGKAIGADANFAPAYRERGDVYQLYNQYQLARDDYKKYLELTKNDTRAKVLYVKFLYICGNYQETIDEINSIKDTTTVLMRRLKGYSYFKTGQFESAEKAMADYFTNTKPDFYMYDDYELYGRTFKVLGNMEKAEEQFMNAIKMDSTRLAVLDTLTEFYDKAKDYKNQARLLQKSIDIRKSTDYRDFYYLGTAYYYAKDSINAEKAFVQAIKGNESYEPSHYWLGNVLKKQKRTADAVVEYEKVMTLLEAKPKETLKKTEKDHLINATLIVTSYYYNPDKEHPTNDCVKAKPYMVKLSQLVDFEAADYAYWKNALQQCP